MPYIHILLADDSQAWRGQVQSLLEPRPELRVVCEVSDGLEAVQQSEKVQPDLILLDIRLPTLNGIEVARRLRTLAPRSRILVLSQEADPDIVQKVLNFGALGYIHKPRAHRELLPAIESVLAGRQFLGSGLKGYKLQEPLPAQGSHRHDVVFYSNDTICVDSLADFAVKALKAGKIAFVVVTNHHREGFLRKVRADYADVDIDAAIQERTCVILDSVETIRETTVDGVPDCGKLVGLIESAVKSASRERHGIAACGECAPLLWAEGNKEAAIQVEQLWNDLAKTHGINLLCAYPLDGFQGKENEEGLKKMCAEHMAVYFG